jgi:O-antigen ligase
MKDILSVCLLFIILVLFYPIIVGFFPVDISVSLLFIIPALVTMGLWYQAFRRKDFHWKLHRFSPITLSFGAFILVNLIGVFHSVYLYASLKSWTLLLNGFLLFLLAGNYQLAVLHEPEMMKENSRREFREYLLWVFFAMGMVQSLWGIYQYTIGFNKQLSEIMAANPQMDSRILSGIQFTLESGRITGSLGNPNLFAILIGLCIPISLGLLYSIQQKGQKILVLAGMASMGIALALSASRGGILAVIIGLIAFIILSGITHLKKNILSLGIILAVTITGILLIQHTRQSSKIENLSTRMEKGSSTIQERLIYWRISEKMIKDRPVLGGGLASFAILYGQYKPENAGESRYAHNTFLQTWSEGGIITLLALLVFMGVILVYPLCQWRKLQRPEVKLQMAAWYSGVIVFLMDSFYGYAFYWPDLWYSGCILIGGLYATTWAERVPEPTPQDILWRRQPNTAFLLITPGVIFAILIYWCSWAYPSFREELYYQQGRGLLRQGRADLAIPCFRKAVQFVPYQSDYQQHLGMTLAQAGDLQSGIRNMEKAVALNPCTAYLHANLSDLYFEAGDFQKAEAEIRKAIACYPTKKVYQEQLERLMQQRTP